MPPVPGLSAAAVAAAAAASIAVSVPPTSLARGKLQIQSPPPPDCEDDNDDGSYFWHGDYDPAEEDGVSDSPEPETPMKSKKYLRPCKGKRDRYNRAIARMQGRIDQDPFAFDPYRTELPCWVEHNPELKAKFLARLSRMKEKAEEDGLISL